MRIFPLSNWTELDVWRYIEQEKIPVASLYFAEPRRMREMNGLLVTDDDEHPRRQDNPALDVLHARMGEPGTVPSVIVEPKIPAHDATLPR